MNRDPAAAEWRAGTARAVITPEESLWMAGFGFRDSPAEGTLQNLEATALALEDSAGNRAVVVGVDVLFVSRYFREAIAERCATEYDLSPDRLVLNASHTHCGPVTRNAYVEKDGRLVPRNDGSGNFLAIELYEDVDESYRTPVIEYRRRLEDEIVGVVGRALEESSPARLSYGTARCGFGMNRRLPSERGIDHVTNLDGVVDTDVPVLAVESPDGEDVRSVVFGYACHPTSLAITEFSPDWPGYARKYLEEDHDVTALFLQGCAGDQNPYPRRSIEVTKQHGRTIANTVTAALDAERHVVRGPLRAVSADQPIAFDAPPDREALGAIRDSEARGRYRARYLLDVLEEHGEIPTEYPYPIQALGFGDDLTLVALAGEPLSEYGLQLKEAIDGQAWIAGCSNAAFTYVPTAQAIYEGGYEGGDVIRITTYPGTWKPDVEERILRRARALANRVSGPT